VFVLVHSSIGPHPLNPIRYTSARRTTSGRASGVRRTEMVPSVVI
jgi:hypothetical protein